MMETKKKIRLFVSYSHQDKNDYQTLLKQLKALDFVGDIVPWHDGLIAPGEEWKKAILKNLEEANVILLLVSANFLASEFCRDIEMKRALERHEKKEAVVIPIIVRDCLWKYAPFGKLQALPPQGRAVELWPRRNSAWKNVIEGIQQAVGMLQKKNAGDGVGA